MYIHYFRMLNTPHRKPHEHFCNRSLNISPQTDPSLLPSTQILYMNPLTVKIWPCPFNFDLLLTRLKPVLLKIKWTIQCAAIYERRR